MATKGVLIRTLRKEFTGSELEGYTSIRTTLPTSRNLTRELAHEMLMDHINEHVDRDYIGEEGGIVVGVVEEIDGRLPSIHSFNLTNLKLEDVI